MNDLLDIRMKRLDGVEQHLADYRGKVLLLVNVASYCGNTPQYRDLQAMHAEYRDRGFEVLAFPANDFGAQEPGTDAEIAEFCASRYGVTFPVFSKITVRGRDIHPLYAAITSRPAPIGGEVTWNFQKYLVDRRGNVVAKFPPSLSPRDRSIVAKIDELLKQP
ncbi:MAG: glutathione peroxidase [SAR202 cluster bacterium]|nr:glutathione peroxidase [SAR202 cluster bacterium]